MMIPLSSVRVKKIERIEAEFLKIKNYLINSAIEKNR